jgi:hypothetical protein
MVVGVEYKLVLNDTNEERQLQNLSTCSYLTIVGAIIALSKP